MRSLLNVRAIFKTQYSFLIKSDRVFGLQMNIYLCAICTKTNFKHGSQCFCSICINALHLQLKLDQSIIFCVYLRLQCSYESCLLLQYLWGFIQLFSRCIWGCHSMSACECVLLALTQAQMARVLLAGVNGSRNQDFIGQISCHKASPMKSGNPGILLWISFEVSISEQSFICHFMCEIIILDGQNKLRGSAKHRG